MLTKLYAFVHALDHWRVFRDGLETLPLDAPLSDDWKRAVAKHFRVWQRIGRDYDLPHCTFATAQTIGPFDPNEEQDVAGIDQLQEMTTRTALDRIDWLDRSFREDTGHKQIFWMQRGRGEYFDKDFGEAVRKAFPSAISEIKEANTCYALGRDTACVFHLMRAVEHGIRALAIAVGADVAMSPIPLDYQQWGPIIDSINASTEKAANAWANPARANARAFFRRIVSDFYAFKDEIRNVLMHTRSGGNYSQPGAVSVLNRVAECFVLLATKVSEDSPGNILDESRFLP